MFAYELGLISNFIKDPLFAAIIMLLIMGFAIGMFIHHHMERYVTHDPFPKLYQHLPLDLTLNSHTIVPVKVGLSINDILKFDLLNNIFIFDCIIWFQFDPRLLMVSLINKFYFEKGKVIEKSPPTMKLVEEELLVEHPLRLEFSTNLNFINFPIDNHRLFIMLDNIGSTEKDIKFNSSESMFKFLPNLKIFGWSLNDRYVYTGYIKSQLNPEHSETIISHPRAIFEIDIFQVGVRNHGTIFIPVFVAFALSFIALGLNPYKHTTLIISLCAGSISGLLAFRFVLENLTPKVGYYTLADRFFIIFLLMTLIHTLLSLYLITIPTTHQSIVPNLQKIILFILFTTVLIMIFRFLYKRKL